MTFERSIVAEIITALERKAALIQVVTGPRQVGKSTAAGQVERHLG